MLTALACLAFLVPASVACLYYVALSLVASRRGATARREPGHTFAILIPAHNEAQAIPATLRSAFALDYPPDMVRVYVVADNCTDATEAVATDTGVICLTRDDPARRGKGFALVFGLEAVLADCPDAVLVLDADCELDAGALRELDAAFAGGAEAAQLAMRSANPDAGVAGYVAAVGNAVEHRIAQGLDRIGLSAPLRGTGMAFRRTTLERVPWRGVSGVEDAEYAAQLRAAGVRVRLAAGLGVTCAAPPRVSDFCQQRRRWRGALLGGRNPIVRVIQSKPLVAVHLALTAAVSVALADPALIAWAGALVALTVAVYGRAVAAVGLSRHRVALLAGVPLVVARLAWLAAVGLVRRRRATWEAGRAAREPADAEPPARAVQFARRPAVPMRLLHAPFVRTRNPDANHVSLTFDDGPHPVHTPAVLDRLHRYGVAATFYLIGERLSLAPHLPARIAAAGHALGNHTYSHPRFGRLAFAAPASEVAACQALVPQATTFRPPFGRLTPGVWLAARRVGLPVVTWSIDSGDWQCETEADAVACAEQVLRLVRPGDVVLFHDDRPRIGTILDTLLPALAARGLLAPEPQPVSELSRLAHPRDVRSRRKVRGAEKQNGISRY